MFFKVNFVTFKTLTFLAFVFLFYQIHFGSGFVQIRNDLYGSGYLFNLIKISKEILHCNQKFGSVPIHLIRIQAFW